MNSKAPSRPARRLTPKGLNASQADRQEELLAPSTPKSDEGTQAMNQTVPVEAHDPNAWEDVSMQDALNVLSNPIMIADADCFIRFANEAAYKMFEAIEADLRRDLPTFVARKVVGRSIDDFHKHPAHQRRIMDNMIAPHDGKFTVGGKTLIFKATPILDSKGKMTTVFVEWQDRTVAIEEQSQISNLIAEISAMADAHANGMINHFIPLDGFSATLRKVAENANKMVADHIVTKKKVLACVSEFANGNFNAELEKFSGERGFINDAMEGIRASFKKVTAEVERFCVALDKGDLAFDVDRTGFNGDYRKIVDAMERALVGLNQTIASSSQQVQQVSTTVEQLTQASQSLATNSQIASSSVDEVSSSAEETNAQVTANASAANNAAKLVSGTVTVAQDGTQKISEMVAAMEGIRVSSQDIAKIIKVIDEIAFQTNLLALNAAVEAARAGQHGRGFAVVAQEVRNLAGRSAKAARETSDLIEDAATRVKSGVRIADEARDSFTRIASDIQEVQSLVRNIAVSSEEQSRGVAQINMAIGEVAKAALSTSQQADELAASAAQMQSATEIMRRDFDRFKLRPVAQNRRDDLNLDALSPEMLARLQAMLMATTAGQTPPMGRASQPGALDRDERGFGTF
jgi:methyl-accepting chemotaxis protein